jgi:hypothetical protein
MESVGNNNEPGESTDEFGEGLCIVSLVIMFNK